MAAVSVREPSALDQQTLPVVPNQIFIMQGLLMPAVPYNKTMSICTYSMYG